MNQITTMRKIVALWDRRIVQDWLDGAEVKLREELQTLGCPQEEHTFEDSFFRDRIARSLVLVARKTEAWLPYEKALFHPEINIFSPTDFQLYLKQSTIINGIQLSCACTLYGTLPEEAQQTLKMIGKIKYDKGFSTPPQLVLACDL